ncbi:MAG: DUF4177 domain-containing protein [Pseudomonadota bacterium]
MTKYDYKVVAAPRRARRIRGIKTTQDRFAATIAETINKAAAEGWEFYRTETLPMDERQGMLKGRVETLQSLLVFRRALKAEAEAPTQRASGPVLRPPPALDGDGEDMPVILLNKSIGEKAD